jgi:hypothetical protein
MNRYEHSHSGKRQGFGEVVIANGKDVASIGLLKVPSSVRRVYQKAFNYASNDHCNFTGVWLENDSLQKPRLSRVKH